MCESKAISVAYTDDNGKLRLNLTSLSEVLHRPEIQDKKLMIVSIVGEMRTGKSFLMGYAIRYLQNEGWRNKSWMGDDRTKSNGFIWGPGTERNTNAIDMWDKLFTIKDEHGEEVVVILLDTQGLFDYETTQTNNVRMNAMNIFASSLLIMNFQKHITEMDLQNWQLSVDFAKLASNVDANVFELPDLLVLVQNWPNSHEYDYGLEGGKAYINYALEIRDSRKEELNSVRKNIKTSFPILECFLMPFPGENAMQPDFRGTNEEVKGEYLQNVKKYVEHIFDPKNISIKQLQQKAMTPKLYYDFLVSVDELMKSDKIPSVENMAEAFGRVVCSNAYEKCLKQFQANMLSHNKKIIKKEELEELYKRHKKSSVQCYESSATIGTQQLREELRAKLTKELETQFQSIEKNMDVQRKQHVQDIVEKIVQEIEEKLHEAAVQNRDVDRFKNAFTQFKEQAIEKFDRESVNCEPYATEYKKKLSKQIGREYTSLLVLMEKNEKPPLWQKILPSLPLVAGAIAGIGIGFVAGPFARVVGLIVSAAALVAAARASYELRRA